MKKNDFIVGETYTVDDRRYPYFFTVISIEGDVVNYKWWRKEKKNAIEFSHSIKDLIRFGARPLTKLEKVLA